MANSWTLSFTNNLSSTYPDSDVYITIMGKNKDGYFCWMDSSGTVIPMQKSDMSHNVPGANNCNAGTNFANYSFALSTATSVDVPNDSYLNSWQIYISLGSWLPICIPDGDFHPNGYTTGFAPPSVTNPSLQGYNTIFQMLEFTYNVNGAQSLNADITDVDFMGFPVTMTLTDSSNNTQTVGFNKNRASIINDFATCKDTNFQSLIMMDNTTQLRVLSPEHAAAVKDGYQPPPGLGLPSSVITYFSSFYSDYISDCWSYYTTNQLTMYITGIPYYGQVDATGTFNFYTSSDMSGPTVCTIPTPTNSELMLCNGVFKTGGTTALNIQKFVAAAMIRTVFMETPTSTENSWCSDTMKAKYYTNDPINYYPVILHEDAKDNLVYAFAYDDVCNCSSSVQSTTTQSLAITIPAFGTVSS